MQSKEKTLKRNFPPYSTLHAQKSQKKNVLKEVVSYSSKMGKI